MAERGVVLGVVRDAHAQRRRVQHVAVGEEASLRVVSVRVRPGVPAPAPAGVDVDGRGALRLHRLKQGGACSAQIKQVSRGGGGGGGSRLLDCMMHHDTKRRILHVPGHDVGVWSRKPCRQSHALSFRTVDLWIKAIGNSKLAVQHMRVPRYLRLHSTWGCACMREPTINT